MSLIEFVAGKPLATTEERAEHIGAISGIPVFGLDALSSAAYGPEAALTLLIPLGAAGIAHIVPISFAIIGLLTVVYFSYRQTIDAYPNGGGSYTVATENLGESRRSPDRLHLECRRRNLCRSRSSGLSLPLAPAAHSCLLSPDPCRTYAHQHARH